jgi:hypothetical protein
VPLLGMPGDTNDGQEESNSAVSNANACSLITEAV